MEKNIPKTAPCEWCGCIEGIKVWLRIKEGEEDITSDYETAKYRIQKWKSIIKTIRETIHEYLWSKKIWMCFYKF